MKRNSRGDTIVEVLIALCIAGLAIGISYAIAHKAIQRTVAARERDQAIGYLESQLNALKLREQADPTGFTAAFINTSTHHYCLDESASTSSDPTWPAITNQNVTTLKVDPVHYYNGSCVKANLYYLDIDTTTQDPTATPATKFRLDVRWPRLGGGPDNDATFYYRF